MQYFFSEYGISENNICKFKKKIFFAVLLMQKSDFFDMTEQSKIEYGQKIIIVKSCPNFQL